MDENQMHQILAHNIEHLMDQEQNHTPSMRYLSTCIDANEGYIQKIINGSAFPSFEKFLAIANHYEKDPWMLLYNSMDENDVLFSTIQLLNECPENLLPVVQEFLKYLITVDKSK